MSAGVLCRCNGHILLILKQYSLSYAHFICGCYSDNIRAEKLLSQINYNERNLLMKKPIEELFKICFNSDIPLEKLKKFDDFGEYLFDMYSCTFKEYVKGLQSFRNKPLWEIPKGHQLKDEDTLDCAVRELEEETGLKINTWMLNPEPYIYKSGKKTIYYYVCDLDEKIVPTIKDTREISYAAWFNIKKVKKKVPYEIRKIIRSLCHI